MNIVSKRNHAVIVVVGLAVCAAVSMGSPEGTSGGNKRGAVFAGHDIPVYYAVFLTKTAKWPKDESSPLVSHVDAHRHYMGELRDRGVTVIGGPYYPDAPGAILIMKAEDLEEASKLIGDDPCVKNGLFSREIKPFYAAIRPSTQP